MPRILVADDDADTRELLRVILSRAGHEVLLAADGDEGLRLVRAHRPALVILDIFMPVKDGIEVIRELRSEDAEVKILAISAGWGQLDILREAQLLGADLTMRKPLEPDRLVKVVEALLQPD